MANNSSVLGATVSNISPARYPGLEPIIGQHVTLERLSESHIPALYSSVGKNTDVWTYLGAGPFTKTSDFAHEINKWISMSDTGVFYSIIVQGQAAGLTCLWPIDLSNRVAEIGLMYGPALQRTRAATEVLYLLGCLLFEELNFRRWEWKCDNVNVSSTSAAKRYGFVYEGCFRQHKIVRGKNRDTAWFSMLDGEWSRCKEVFQTWLGDSNFDEQGRQRRSLSDVRENLVKREL